jgi:HK97 gp10 family phage protein
MNYIEGSEQLIAKLASLKKTVAKRAISKGCRAGSKAIQTAAKRIAPHRTGKLETAIKVRALTRSRVWTGTKVTLVIAYGAATEYGTSKETGKHFLEKAAAQAGQQAVDTALDIIKQEVESV